MGASITVMLSYDYCHFEVSKSSNEDLSDKQINEMRKDCQRLADEAVRQYKKAKQIAVANGQLESERDSHNRRLERIMAIPESERTPEQMAYLKQADDADWQKRFDRDEYDYEDDDETYVFEE